MTSCREYDDLLNTDNKKNIVNTTYRKSLPGAVLYFCQSFKQQSKSLCKKHQSHSCRYNDASAACQKSKSILSHFK